MLPIMADWRLNTRESRSSDSLKVLSAGGCSGRKGQVVCLMSCHDLRDFLYRLEELGELQKIAAPVSPLLEIAAITDRVCKGHRTGRCCLQQSTGAGSGWRPIFSARKNESLALGVEQLCLPYCMVRCAAGNLQRRNLCRKACSSAGNIRLAAAAPVMTSVSPPVELINAAEGLAALPV